MAIIASADLGIGDVSSSAYIRITSFHYQIVEGDSVPEIEIGISLYHNKTCRNFEISKGFTIDYLTDNLDTLTPEQFTDVQNSILARTAYPLQSMMWATKDLSKFSVDFSTMTEEEGINYFYNWIKNTQVMGKIDFVSDDFDTADDIVRSFASTKTEIFGDAEAVEKLIAKKKK